MTNTVDLWVNYKKVLDDVFPEFKFDSRWCEWTGKGGMQLTADIFTAPHFIKSRRVDIYNEKSDIWALGCLMYEITMLKPPFNAKNGISLAKKIVSQGISPYTFI